VSQHDREALTHTSVPAGGHGVANSVLVVEDQRDAREMLTQYLAFCGFVVYEAADGIEAIEVALRVHPHIILMDLMMPRLDGWEATRRLKAEARTKDITIIALSALTQTDAQHDARHVGCDGFISKPCDLPSLVAVLRAIFHRRSGANNISQPGPYRFVP
jgi:DNA-binding response OmpR family regulator